jgi:hypothetical protein
VLFIAAYFLIKEAFGPKYRTVNISIDKNKTLIGHETYNADFAAVFYDVNFELIVNNKDTFKIGNGTFSNENWDKVIRLYEIDNWFILPVNDNSYSKLLMTNKISRQSIDTVFSPLDLRYDSLWKSKYKDIPSWPYGGLSKIDTLQNDRLSVTYNYRIGDYEPFKFYRQTLEYNIDFKTGNIKTIQVADRIERK